MVDQSKRTRRGGHEGCIVVEESQLKSYDAFAGVSVPT